MILANVRLIVVGLILSTAVYVHSVEGVGRAWYLYLAALVLTMTHFLFGNVWAAFAQLKKGNIQGAEKLLSATHFPNWLLSGHRAYYFFTKGMIALQRNELAIAEPHLEQAVQLGLRTDNDNALARLNLAHIAFVQKRFEIALSRLQKAKTFKTNDLVIKEHLQKMELALQGRMN